MMENTPLYKEKVEILGRLIKASSLTLKEALILLKDEEPVSQVPGQVSPWWGVPPESFTGSGTVTGGFVTTTTTANAYPTGHSTTDTTILPPDINS